MGDLGFDLGKTLVKNVVNAVVTTFGPKFLDEEVVQRLLDNVECVRRGVESLRHVDYKRAVDNIEEAIALLQVSLSQVTLSRFYYTGL